MCCLFGIIDIKGILSGRQKSRMLSILATECEARGTDATGIAYNGGGKLRIYKRPWPARFMRFRIPGDVRVIMGHTRLTTQGSEKRNYNNHPFEGRTREGAFALAHNGVLHNDRSLRKSQKLPHTRIETDSYVAVQLIEQKKTLHLDSLQYMAEAVEGSFNFTVLDERDTLYIIKGDNPLCLVHFPKAGLYLYASTKEILGKAMKKMHLPMEKPVEVEVDSGDILQIDRAGVVTRGQFDDAKFYRRWYEDWGTWPYFRLGEKKHNAEKKPYIQELKSVAGAFGYTPEMIDRLLSEGFLPEEIEEFLYGEELGLC